MIQHLVAIRPQYDGTLLKPFWDGFRWCLIEFGGVLKEISVSLAPLMLGPLIAPPRHGVLQVLAGKKRRAPNCACLCKVSALGRRLTCWNGDWGYLLVVCGECHSESTCTSSITKSLLNHYYIITDQLLNHDSFITEALLAYPYMRECRLYSQLSQCSKFRHCSKLRRLTVVIEGKAGCFG